MDKPAEQKQQLRREMSARRAALSHDDREAAAKAVLRHLPHMPLREEVESVAVYYPVRHEFDALPILDELTRQGLKTSLPVVEDGEKPLSFHAWKVGEALEPGPFDIPIPADRFLSVLPDMLIMPLLGFDRHGNRLGYGGGHYDRTLEAMRPITEVMAVGLAYEFQELEQVPSEPHDQHLDYILTPVGWRRL